MMHDLVTKLSANSETATSRRAIFSPCEAYRYWLEITWNSLLPTMVACMLNPSTADEMKNDPTVERMERRARTMGYGSLIVVNVFAYRATDPEEMAKQKDPIGPCNMGFLIMAARVASRRAILVERSTPIRGFILCGWGKNVDKVQPGLGWVIRDVLESHSDEPPYCLGMNADGSPRHPLYIAASTQPRLYNGEQ